MANGDLLKEVKELLDDPQSMTSKTALRLTLSMLAELYIKVEDDHKKMDEIYPAYKWGKWVFLAVTGTVLADVVKRMIELMQGMP